MTITHEHIAQLYLRRLEGTISNAESTELDAWLVNADRSSVFLMQLQEEESVSNWLAEEIRHRQNGTEDILLERIKQRILLEEKPAQSVVHRGHFLKTAWLRNPGSLQLRWAKYAAAIIILFGIGAYLWNINTKNENTASTAITPEAGSAKAVKDDIAPGSNKAILTLSNGQQIELNSAAETIKDGTLSIENNNGQLIYGNYERGSLSRSPAAGREEGRFNTMSTPRGGTYQLTLPDGSKVWLNAASSITFPTVFPEKDRIVTLAGEAYFEIVKNKSKPFIVKTAVDKIMVLGTSFNVNSYKDEPVLKTSLLEGSIKINDQVLLPGEAYNNGKVTKANIEQDLAWKNGLFNFSGAELPVVLRQLSRWYDIDVRYEGKGTGQRIIGKLSRHLPLSEVLDALQVLNVKFRVEGKTLIVE